MTILPDLLTASLEDIKAGLEGSRFTSVDLVTAYLARIEEINPILRPVLELNAYAALDAQILDAERQSGKLRGCLHGLPILVKDTIGSERPDQTYMNTTAGSYALYGSVPEGDATVIAKLKEAGAIILGKTNVSEFSNYRTVDSDSGWSGRGGQTYGPYFDKQNASGSSSGSAVASAIGLAVACLGAETCGSIISPSYHCNIVGIKPTPGLTSRHGVIPASSTYDTVGPMAGDVKTCATILQVIAGKDAKDNLTSGIPFDAVPDYINACKTDALQGVRIGVPTAYLEAKIKRGKSELKSLGLEHYKSMIPVLRELGAVVIENVDFPELERCHKELDHFTVVGTESLHLLPKYLASLKSNPTGIKNMKDLIAFSTNCRAEETDKRNMGRWEEWVERDLKLDSPEYLKALEMNAYIGGEVTIGGAMRKHNLEAMIFPSACYSLAGAGCLPMITVPCGHNPPDHPLVKSESGNLNEEGPNGSHGLGFVGPKFSEKKLIGLAYAFEQATQIRNNVQPLHKPKTQLSDIMGWQEYTTDVAEEHARIRHVL